MCIPTVTDFSDFQGPATSTSPPNTGGGGSSAANPSLGPGCFPQERRFVRRPHRSGDREEGSNEGKKVPYEGLKQASPGRSVELTPKKKAIRRRRQSDGALHTTACRAKRENGGLGEDPPGSPMTDQPIQPTHSRKSESSFLPDPFVRFVRTFCSFVRSQ
jgi:hypothetical protein